MMEIYTIALVVVAIVSLRQAAFQNRSFLFEKRFKLYEEFSENMYWIYMLETNTTSKAINTINLQNFDNIKFQTEMYRFYIDPLVSTHRITEGIKCIYINEGLKTL